MSTPFNVVAQALQQGLVGKPPTSRTLVVLIQVASVWLPLGLLMLAAAYMDTANFFEGAAGFTPLHTVLEFFAIVVAFQVFGTGWFSSGPRPSLGSMLLACMFLATGLLDIGHTLSYIGMPNFVSENSANKAILFWLAARYMVVFGLLSMLFTHSRLQAQPISRLLIMSGTLVGVLGLFWLFIFHEQLLPVMFVPEQGLTSFKVGAEYMLILGYLVCALAFFWKHENTGNPVLQNIGYAAVIMSISELCFTLYTSVSGTFNVLGHIYKVLAYALIYRALFVSYVRQPYEKLAASNDRLRHIARAISEDTGQVLLNTLAVELSRLLKMKYVVISHVTSADQETAPGRVVAMVEQGRLRIPVHDELSLIKHLCGADFHKGLCRIDAGIRQRFPDKELLKKLDIESCLGMILFDSEDRVIGEIAALDTRPLENQLPVEEIMQIFAARAEAELERINSHTQIKSSEQKLKSILGNIQDGVFRTDLEQELIWVSASAERITGYSQDELLGKHIADFHQTRDGHEKFLSALDASGGILKGYELPLVRKDGSPVWVSVNAHYYYDEDGFVLGVEGSVRDIESQKQAEQALTTLNENLEAKVGERTRQLESAYKELESFSYSVSHDLRAPLNHVSGFSDLFKRKYEDTLDDTGREYLDRIIGGCQRMSELIEDLLDLSQITRYELQRKEVNLSAVANEVVKQLSERCSGEDVSVNIHPDVKAVADEKLVRIVLENLLGNACKFSRKSANPMIEFGVDYQKNPAVYYVKDNGAGFDMDYANKLFAPFQRLHSDKEFEGNGIGLATVARIVQRHGGEIWADSEVGKGACFYFSLNESL